MEGLNGPLRLNGNPASFHRQAEQCEKCTHYYKNVTSISGRGDVPSTEEVLQLASIILDRQCIAGESVTDESACGHYKRTTL